MKASEFFNEPHMDGEVHTQPDNTYLWFINYIGDANSGIEDLSCSDVTWNDYCDAANIIHKHGYEVTESYSEHDYVSAFRKVDTNPILYMSDVSTAMVLVVGKMADENNRHRLF